MDPWSDERYIEVAAPPDAVYRYLADFTSHLDWAEHVVDVERPAGGFVVGASFTIAGATVAHHRTVRITALQSPLRISFEVDAASGREQWEFLLLPAAQGHTTLARRVTLEPAGTVRWLLTQRRRAARLTEENRAGLERIKTAIEGSIRLEA